MSSNRGSEVTVGGSDYASGTEINNIRRNRAQQRALVDGRTIEDSKKR